MLNVSYMRTYGYINVLGSDNKTIYKCLIHPANALFGCVYHDRKQHLAHLITFAIDLKHLERCLKDKIDKENFIKIVIYINTDWNEKFKVVKLFAKYGYNVEMKLAKRWKRNAKKKTVSK